MMETRCVPKPCTANSSTCRAAGRLARCHVQLRGLQVGREPQQPPSPPPPLQPSPQVTSYTKHLQPAYQDGN